MAANPNTPGDHVTGVVASVNPKGIRLEGESEWRHFSKFAEVVPPMRGQLVTVTLDRQSWVRSISTESVEKATDGHQGPVAGRETAIVRQTCIKAATAFCAARPALKSADLFVLAEKMEAWVAR